MTEQDWAERERDLAHEAEHEEAVAMADLPLLREAVATIAARRQSGSSSFPREGGVVIYSTDLLGERAVSALVNAAPALLDELASLRDNDVRGTCIIEAAIRSPSIAHYMSHWEGRCLKAEADLDRLATDYTDLGELLFGEAEYEHGDVRGRVVSLLDELEAEREKHDEGAYDDMKAAKDKAEADLAALKARWDTLRASSKGLWEGREMMTLERGGCENCAHRHGADDKRVEWSCGEISEDGEGVRYFNVRFTCGAWAAKETL